MVALGGGISTEDRGTCENGLGGGVTHGWSLEKGTVRSQSSPGSGSRRSKAALLGLKDNINIQQGGKCRLACVSADLGLASSLPEYSGRAG